MCGNGPTFDDIIGTKFKEIKNKFKSKSESLYEEFDEDVFIDAYIKCHDIFANKTLSQEEYIKYFWTAYSNNFKTARSKIVEVSFEDITPNQIISINDSYNVNIDKKYQEIIDFVTKKFGDYYASAWIKHVCEDISYKELDALRYNFKYNDVFKKINKIVRDKFKKL